MREIKFRAWDKEKKIMGYFDFTDIFAQTEYGDPEPYISTNQYDKKKKDWYHAFNIDPHEIEKIELMQYTGVKDKNGKEIYEGDIIKHQWHDDLIILKDFNELIDFYGSYSQCGIIEDSIEVIGNIYENKELLE